MPYEDAREKPEDSAYRFVVRGHPELGEFLDWDTAVAAAWEVTPPGAQRRDVTLAQKGVVHVRTEDPPAPPANQRFTSRCYANKGGDWTVQIVDEELHHSMMVRKKTQEEALAYQERVHQVADGLRPSEGLETLAPLL